MRFYPIKLQQIFLVIFALYMPISKIHQPIKNMEYFLVYFMKNRVEIFFEIMSLDAIFQCWFILRKISALFLAIYQRREFHNP